jgi:hypothetical protein
MWTQTRETELCSFQALLAWIERVTTVGVDCFEWVGPGLRPEIFEGTGVRMVACPSVSRVYGGALWAPVKE